jgi:hypothetical protein
MSAVNGKTIAIKLKKPLFGHGGAVNEVILREPTYAEYMEIGDPFLVGLAPDSRIPFMVEDHAVITAYARLLLVSPDALIVEQGGMALAREIRSAVRSFFQDGAEAAGDSAISPTSSPLAPDKTAAQ